MTPILSRKINSIKQTKVIQSIPVWLPQTQTWIYNQVKYLPKYIYSHIVCGKTENLDQFSLPDIHVIPEKSIIGRYNRSHFKAISKLSRQLWLWNKCLMFKPDVIHSHFGTTGWYDSLIARLTKSKHVVTFYGYDVNMIPNNPLWRLRYKALFQSADLFLCEGPHMSDCIISLGCSREKIRVHHLGVEVDTLPFKPRRWHTDEPLRILIAASFREKKGIPYALDAIGRLKNKVNFEITIIGDVTEEDRTIEEKERIFDVIDKNNLRAQIKMLGFQPYSVLMEQAYKHHIFLSPSVTAKDGDTEGGAPVSIIEMIATGMPVVSSTHCDIPEVITHGLTGFLAMEKNTEELAKHIYWLVKHSEKWIDIIEAGYTKVKNEFNVSSQAAGLGKLYESVV